MGRPFVCSTRFYLNKHSRTGPGCYFAAKERAIDAIAVPAPAKSIGRVRKESRFENTAGSPTLASRRARCPLSVPACGAGIRRRGRAIKPDRTRSFRFRGAPTALRQSHRRPICRLSVCPQPPSARLFGDQLPGSIRRHFVSGPGDAKQLHAAILGGARRGCFQPLRSPFDALVELSLTADDGINAAGRGCPSQFG